MKTHFDNLSVYLILNRQTIDNDIKRDKVVLRFPEHWYGWVLERTLFPV